MITNRKQYVFFKRLLCTLRVQRRILVQQVSSRSNPGVFERVLSEHDSYTERIQQELIAYRMLEKGDAEPPDLTRAHSLPADLIRARILLGWSQRALAERVGMKAQQIQRYESTGYQSARFDRVATISRLLDDALRRGSD